ncbi:MAG: RuvX/YqgF family protein, partial [Syntrophobacterales bacterium]|nr:RuvX/YqgF family protein [Syntrophobacterales bacterium]
EALSTKEAESLLIEADMNRRKRRGVVDKLAAAIILQDYLDHMRNK